MARSIQDKIGGKSCTQLTLAIRAFGALRGFAYWGTLLCIGAACCRT
jgi:hypothetical protein